CLHGRGAHRQRPRRHRSITEVDPMLQDVGGAVVVEVAGAVYVPVGTVHIDSDVRLHRVVIHCRHFKGALAAYVPMLQDVGGAIVVEVGGGVHDPIPSTHGDLDLSRRGRHWFDQKASRPGGRIINVDEEVGYPVAIEIAGT